MHQDASPATGSVTAAPRFDDCASCKFWSPLKSSDHEGYCLRFPPVSGGWPVTDAKDWCGEYVAR